jgi:L-ascorbate metabolism protein UlaG (beta-lactamase superfamily)
VTHQHPDHVDEDRLPALLQANSNACLVTDPDTAELAEKLGVYATSLADGESLEIGPVTVQGVGELHALIHDDVPRVRNTGMRLTAEGEPTLFHTGDAVDAEPGDVDIVSFALSAPWAASRDMTGLLRRLAPPVAIPVHDALLSATGRELYLTQARNFGSKDTEIRDLADGRPQEFTAG